MGLVEDMAGGVVDIQQDGVELTSRLLRVEAFAGLREGEEVAFDKAAAGIVGQLGSQGDQVALVPADDRGEGLDDQQGAYAAIGECRGGGITQAEAADHYIEWAVVTGGGQSQQRQLRFTDVKQARHQKFVAQLHLIDFDAAQTHLHAPAQTDLAERCRLTVEFREHSAHVGRSHYRSLCEGSTSVMLFEKKYPAFGLGENATGRQIRWAVRFGGILVWSGPSDSTEAVLHERECEVSFDCVLGAWGAHESEILDFLTQRVGDRATAEDVLQDVFLKAMRQGQGFCELDNPRAWLFQVARNAMTDQFRRVRPRAELTEALPAADDDGRSPVDELEACVARNLVHLKAVDRAVLEACDLQSMTVGAFAEREGLSLAAAKSRLLRARERLRAELIRNCQVRFDASGSICCHVSPPNTGH